MRASTTRWAALIGTGVLTILMCSAVLAQVPPPPGSPEAADIASCLCLKQEVDALSAESAAKRQDYDGLHAELGRIDAQLEAERSHMDVNDPASVARFRQLLDRRDALFKRSTGEAFNSAQSISERYNTRVGEYNSRCANRPRDPRLLAQVQATLVCPRSY
jgi:hypothetical protein